MSSTAVPFTPIAAATAAPVRLAMQRLWLTGRVSTAGARLTVHHVFRSEEEKPLEVIYSFPLPRDAALRAFRITGDGFEAHSELKPTEEAVKAYEQAVAQGSLSALARQYGDGLLNLTVGNIRPKEKITVYLELLAGVELRDGGFRFRFPFTLAPAYHSRMKAAQVADGEGEIELPADEFGDVILPRFRKDADGLHEVGFELSVLHQLAIEEIGSPSHAIRVKQDGAMPARVALAADKDVPNRDLILDLQFKEVATEVLAGATGNNKRHFAAIVPSTIFGTSTKTPRRTVIVVDRSGSMQGAPMAQARKAIEACLGALAEDDAFGVVAFDNQIETLDASLLTGTLENREKARTFLSGIDARGGTELAQGILAASRMLHNGGDILILTDGQVAGTEQILAQARATNMRLFCLGIGSASQDRFLSLLARETGGISRFVTAQERVDMAAVDLFASMGRPVASGLKTTSNVQPELPVAVFSGTPLLLFGEMEDDSREIELGWDGGRLNLPIPAGDTETGQTVRLLQGSRLITDWESRYPSVEALAPLEKRKQSRVAARLAELSHTYGLASREMSLVAIVKRAGDRPGELPDTRVVPVGMPRDTNFGAYFNVPVGATFGAMFSPMPTMAAGPQAPPLSRPTARATSGSPVGFGALFGSPSRRRSQTVEDTLMDLASSLEPDGGMPGWDLSKRATRSVTTMMAFVSQGHTLNGGAFRSHVARLVTYLKSVSGVSDRERAVIQLAIQAASSGCAPKAEWLELARQPATPWSTIEKALEGPGSGRAL